MHTISFPALGITLKIDPVAFRIGTWPVYWYGIIIACGFALAIVYASLRAKKTGLDPDTLMDGVLMGAPMGVVCARIYYCLFHFEQYTADPASILRIWDGGLAIYGGIIGAIVFVLIFCRVQKISTGNLLDLLAMGLLIGQSIGRWGNFCNAEAFGRDILPAADGSLPFYAMTLSNHPEAAVHPLFLYESLLNLLLFVGLHFYFKRRKFHGEIFLLYMAGYGLIRFCTEGLRGNDALLLWNTNIRISQLLAILFALCSLIILFAVFIRRRKVRNDAAYSEMVENLSENASAETTNVKVEGNE